MCTWSGVFQKYKSLLQYTEESYEIFENGYSTPFTVLRRYIIDQICINGHRARGARISRPFSHNRCRIDARSGWGLCVGGEWRWGDGRVAVLVIVGRCDVPD